MIEYKVTIGSVSGTTTNTNITLDVSSLIDSNPLNKTPLLHILNHLVSNNI